MRNIEEFEKTQLLSLIEQYDSYIAYMKENENCTAIVSIHTYAKELNKKYGGEFPWYQHEERK